MNQKQVYVLGAGFSKAAKLPTSSEFLIDEAFVYLYNKIKRKRKSEKFKIMSNLD